MSNQITWVDNVPLYAGTGAVFAEMIEVTTMNDVKPQFINGLPVAYRNELRLWACHYCGTKHPDDMRKCPNCGGERR